MAEVLFCFLVAVFVLIISFAWSVFNWIWLNPMKMEKFLRERGIRGPPYILFHGNTKEMVILTRNARSKPMELSHRIVPRILPLIHKMANSYVSRESLKKNSNMAEVVFCFLVGVFVLIVSFAWSVFNWIWLNPMKMEKFLREEGIRGPPYILFHGNTKERVILTRNARSKPMELSHRIVPRILPLIHKMANSYGKIFVTWNGPTPEVTILDSNLIRDILTYKFGHFARIKANPLGNLVTKGIVRYEGEKWEMHRRIINRAFHQDKLKMMLPAFYTCCSELVSRWQKLVSEDSKELDVWPDLHNLSADVISRTAFGSSYEEGQRIFQLQAQQLGHLIQSYQSTYIPGIRFFPTKRNRRMMEIYKEVRAMVREIINKREKSMALGEESKEDLLGILMQSNSEEIKHGGNGKNIGMSIDEIIEECKLFYFAGQETTSSLIVWTMIVLSMHPEWQEKAREEVLRVFGKNEPDFEVLNQLKIVAMVLYEVLRLYPPIPSITRSTYKKMKVGDFLLPAGVQISLPTLLIHHDRELWGEDVEEFNPQRFSQGISKATKNQAAFFPFGWGPKICIGQTFALIEAKMAISMMLQHFSFELSTTYAHAPCTLVTIQPQHGAQLILHKL